MKNGYEDEEDGDDDGGEDNDGEDGDNDDPLWRQHFNPEFVFRPDSRNRGRVIAVQQARNDHRIPPAAHMARRIRL